jgi:hypothetical protein
VANLRDDALQALDGAELLEPAVSHALRELARVLVDRDR